MCIYYFSFLLSWYWLSSAKKACCAPTWSMTYHCLYCLLAYIFIIITSRCQETWLSPDSSQDHRILSLHFSFIPAFILCIDMHLSFIFLIISNHEVFITSQKNSPYLQPLSSYHYIPSTSCIIFYAVYWHMSFLSSPSIIKWFYYPLISIKDYLTVTLIKPFYQLPLILPFLLLRSWSAKIFEDLIGNALTHF